MIWEEKRCVPSELMSRNIPEGTEKNHKYLQAAGLRFQLGIS
jgi:hypothetical protein